MKDFEELNDMLDNNLLPSDEEDELWLTSK